MSGVEQSIPAEPGKIVSFYSYKGGTGRSMALVNCAALLGRKLAAEIPARQVVVIDCDFEAPGLHRYLRPYLTNEAVSQIDSSKGCLDLFDELAKPSNDFDPKNAPANRTRTREILNGLSFDDFCLPTKIPGLSLMKAGRFDDKYAARVNKFDWEELFHRAPGLFDGWVDFFAGRFAYTFVDARTGITDTSNICTMLLAEKLVVVFTPNEQSLTGVPELVRKASAYRRSSTDLRPLSVFPVPSRIELARPQLLERWRNGAGTAPPSAPVRKAIPVDELGYETLFEALFRDIYDLETCDLKAYFDQIQIQHVPDYAYGEPLAVELEATESRLQLRASYQRLVDCLVEQPVPWVTLEEVRAERQVTAAMARLQAAVDAANVLDIAKLSHFVLELFRGSPSSPQSQGPAVLALLGKAAAAVYPGAPDEARALLKNAAGVSEVIFGAGSADHANELDRLGSVSLSATDFTTAREAFEASAEMARRALSPDHPHTLEILSHLGMTLQELGKHDEALGVRTEIMDRRLATLGEGHPDTHSAMVDQAVTLSAMGRLAEARKLQEAVLERRRPLGAHHPLVLSIMNDLATTLADANDPGARPLQEEVVAARRKVLGEEHPDTLTSLSDLAEMLGAEGRLDEEETLEERVLEIRNRILGNRHPDTLISASNLSETLRLKGELARARALQEGVLSARKEIFGERHPDTLMSMSNLAAILGDQGDLSGERALEQELVHLYQDVLGAEHPLTLIVVSNLAATLRALGAVEHAMMLDEGVLAVRERVLGPLHPDTLGSLHALGVASAALGDLPRARMLLTQAAEQRHRVRGPTHGDTLASMSELGNVLLAEGDAAASRALQEQVIAIRIDTLGSEHPDTLVAMERLARVLRQQGQAKDALPLLEQVLDARARKLGEEHPDTLEAMKQLGDTLKALGDFEGYSRLLEGISGIQGRLLRRPR